MRPVRPYAVAILLLAGTTACTSATGPAEADFAASLQRWRASGLVNYSYKSKTICYCTPEFTQPVTITVRAGKVTAVTDRVTGAARPIDGRITIDSLFSLAADEIRSRPDRLQVTYDAVLGYPRSVTYGTPENDAGGYLAADSVVAIPQ